MHLIMMRVATVLTVYGIETITEQQRQFRDYVATVLTVYGIETRTFKLLQCAKILQLQQSLPFTVLKLSIFNIFIVSIF